MVKPSGEAGLWGTGEEACLSFVVGTAPVCSDVLYAWSIHGRKGIQEEVDD